MGRATMYKLAVDRMFVDSECGVIICGNQSSGCGGFGGCVGVGWGETTVLCCAVWCGVGWQVGVCVEE